jgi:hypothetical protein
MTRGWSSDRADVLPSSATCENEYIRLIEILNSIAVPGDETPESTLVRVLTQTPAVPPGDSEIVSDHAEHCPAHAAEVEQRKLAAQTINVAAIAGKLIIVLALVTIIWAIGQVAGFFVFLAINLVAALNDECLVLYYRRKYRRTDVP